MFSLSRLPRMTTPSLFCLVLLVLVLLAAPQQLPVIAYKLVLVVGAGIAGYGLDRALFPYARPHVVSPDCCDDIPLDGPLVLYVALQLRRAVIVAAAMLAVGLGL